MFYKDRKAINAALCEVASHYEKSAPTVETWADWLCSAADENITLADLRILYQLDTERPPGNLAANIVYHLQNLCGRDTTGQAGF